MPLEQYLPLQVLAFLIVFTRIATDRDDTASVGEAFVPMRVRLLFAMLLTLVVSPLISSHLPPEPRTLVDLF